MTVLGTWCLLLCFLSSCGSDEPTREYRLKKASAIPFIWSKPAPWKEKPGSAMRLAGYEAQAEGGTATCSVSLFGGEGGGLAANINRWRMEMGLPTLPEAAIVKECQTVQIAGFPATLVQLKGKHASHKMGSESTPTGNEPTPIEKEEDQMIGIVALTKYGALFIKMIGPISAVQQHESHFQSFYRSFAIRK